VIARFDQQVFEGMLRRIIRAHKFFNHNADPTEIHIPLVKEVDGITVKYVKVPPPELNVSAAKEVLNATTSR